MDSSHGKRRLEFLLVGFSVFFMRFFNCRFDVLSNHLKMANIYISLLLNTQSNTFHTFLTNNVVLTGD